MKQRIVLALGGNALGTDLEGQMKAVQSTAGIIADLAAAGHELVITHGNGPQVGMIHQAFEAASATAAHSPVLPMSVCVALSQGYIGYDLQNALHEALEKRGVDRTVVSMVTQVRVCADDPAFTHPNKPIGSFMDEKAAQALQRKGVNVAEDAGRGWRRVVASPAPRQIIELDAIKTLLNAGHIPVTVGGGGIPVINVDGHLKGANAVIDKDLASAVLARDLDADVLIILTAVEKVAINFQTDNPQWLSRITPQQARGWMDEGQFAPGSMLPKVQAAVDFAESRPGRRAIITLLSNARQAIEGLTGTVISL